MKIQLASDLHLEFLQKRFPGECVIRPLHDADLLILAGDIACSTQAIDLFIDWPVASYICLIVYICLYSPMFNSSILPAIFTAIPYLRSDCPAVYGLNTVCSWQVNLVFQSNLPCVIRRNRHNLGR